MSRESFVETRTAGLHPTFQPEEREDENLVTGPCLLSGRVVRCDCVGNRADQRLGLKLLELPAQVFPELRHHLGPCGSTTLGQVLVERPFNLLPREGVHQ